MKPDKKDMQMPPFMPFPGNQIIETDPQGSYTGVPEEILEHPVQDADDL